MYRPNSKGKVGTLTGSSISKNTKSQVVLKNANQGSQQGSLNQMNSVESTNSSYLYKPTSQRLSHAESLHAFKKGMNNNDSNSLSSSRQTMTATSPQNVRHAKINSSTTIIPHSTLSPISKHNSTNANNISSSKIKNISLIQASPPQTSDNNAPFSKANVAPRVAKLDLFESEQEKEMKRPLDTSKTRNSTFNINDNNTLHKNNSSSSNNRNANNISNILNNKRDTFANNAKEIKKYQEDEIILSQQDYNAAPPLKNSHLKLAGKRNCSNEDDHEERLQEQRWSQPILREEKRNQFEQQDIQSNQRDGTAKNKEIRTSIDRESRDSYHNNRNNFNQYNEISSQQQSQPQQQQQQRSKNDINYKDDYYNYNRGDSNANYNVKSNNFVGNNNNYNKDNFGDYRDNFHQRDGYDTQQNDNQNRNKDFYNNGNNERNKSNNNQNGYFNNYDRTYKNNNNNNFDKSYYQENRAPYQDRNFSYNNDISGNYNDRSTNYPNQTYLYEDRPIYDRPPNYNNYRQQQPPQYYHDFQMNYNDRFSGYHDRSPHYNDRPMAYNDRPISYNSEWTGNTYGNGYENNYNMNKNGLYQPFDRTYDQDYDRRQALIYQPLPPPHQYGRNYDIDQNRYYDGHRNQIDRRGASKTPPNESRYDSEYNVKERNEWRGKEMGNMLSYDQFKMQNSEQSSLISNQPRYQRQYPPPENIKQANYQQEHSKPQYPPNSYNQKQQMNQQYQSDNFQDFNGYNQRRDKSPSMRPKEDMRSFNNRSSLQEGSTASKNIINEANSFGKAMQKSQDQPSSQPSKENFMKKPTDDYFTSNKQVPSRTNSTSEAMENIFSKNQSVLTEDMPIQGQRNNTQATSKGGAKSFTNFEDIPIKGATQKPNFDDIPIKGKASPYDKPIQGGSKQSSNFDDMPIKGAKANNNYNNNNNIDEIPIKGMNSQSHFNQMGNKQNVNNFDDKPIKAMNNKANNFDEMPIKGKNTQNFDEMPIKSSKSNNQSSNFDDMPIKGKKPSNNLNANANSSNGFQSERLTPNNNRLANKANKRRDDFYEDEEGIGEEYNQDEGPVNKTKQVYSREIKTLQSNYDSNDDRPIQPASKNGNYDLSSIQGTLSKKKQPNNLAEQPFPNEKGGKLYSCREGCGRKFAQESLAKHEHVCKKVFQQKRKKFDSAAMRTNIEELNGFDRYTSSTPPPTQKAQKKSKQQESKSQSNGGEAKPRWQKQSEAFRAVINASKTNQPIDPKLSSQISEAFQNEDYVPCNSCGRRFNSTAAKRHIPFCEKKAKENSIKVKENIKSTPQPKSQQIQPQQVEKVQKNVQQAPRPQPSALNVRKQH